jgi:hypothetical protein
MQRRAAFPGKLTCANAMLRPQAVSFFFFQFSFERYVDFVHIRDLQNENFSNIFSDIYACTPGYLPILNHTLE